VGVFKDPEEIGLVQFGKRTRGGVAGGNCDVVNGQIEEKGRYKCGGKRSDGSHGVIQEGGQGKKKNQHHSTLS